MFCHNCGTKLDDGSKFCHSCGTVQEPVSTVMTPMEFEVEKKADVPAFNQEANFPVVDRSADFSAPEAQPYLNQGTPTAEKVKNGASSFVNVLKANKKWIAIACGAIAVIVLAIIFVPMIIAGFSAQNPTIFFKDQEMYISLAEDGSSHKLTSNLWGEVIEYVEYEDGEFDSEVESALDIYIANDLVKFSNKGKTIFYPDKITLNTLGYDGFGYSGGMTNLGSFSLYYRDVSQKNIEDSESVKIATGVTAYAVSEDGKRVYYVKAEEGEYIDSYDGFTAEAETLFVYTLSKDESEAVCETKSDGGAIIYFDIESEKILYKNLELSDDEEYVTETLYISDMEGNAEEIYSGKWYTDDYEMGIKVLYYSNDLSTLYFSVEEEIFSRMSDGKIRNVNTMVDENHVSCLMAANDDSDDIFIAVSSSDIYMDDDESVYVEAGFIMADTQTGGIYFVCENNKAVTIEDFVENDCEGIDTSNVSFPNPMDQQYWASYETDDFFEDDLYYYDFEYTDEFYALIEENLKKVMVSAYEDYLDYSYGDSYYCESLYYFDGYKITLIEESVDYYDAEETYGIYYYPADVDAALAEMSKLSLSELCDEYIADVDYEYELYYGYSFYSSNMDDYEDYYYESVDDLLYWYFDEYEMENFYDEILWDASYEISDYMETDTVRLVLNGTNVCEIEDYALEQAAASSTTEYLLSDEGTLYSIALDGSSASEEKIADDVTGFIIDENEKLFYVKEGEYVYCPIYPAADTSKWSSSYYGYIDYTPAGYTDFINMFMHVQRINFGYGYSGNLYYNDEKIDTDVLLESVQYVSDDCIYYIANYDEDTYCGDLMKYDGKDSEKIKSDVSLYSVTGDKYVYYVTDYDSYDCTGSLKLYDGDRSESIEDDVVGVYTK